jgi:hypothetical protein
MNQSESETSYRAYVQRYAKTNQLAPDDYDALETYRAYLKLLPAQARKIEQEVLASQGSSPSHPPSSVSDGSAASASSSESGCSEPPQPASSATTAAESTETEVSPAQPRSQFNLEEPAQQVKKAATPAASPHQPTFSGSPATVKLNAAYPAATDTTMMPPKSSEQYLAHRQQYREALLHAHQAEGFLLKNSTLESLRKKADELQLSPEDVDDITKKLFEFYMTNNQPVVEPTPTVEPPPPTTLEEKYHPDLRLLFDELEGSLKAKDLQAADIMTLNILLKVIRSSQDWLDEISLRSFSAPSNQDKNAIQEIDHLWDKYSNGNFGFSQQLELYSYDAVPSNDKDLDRERREHQTLALAYSRSAQWWIDGLEFFKYYSQLDFTTEAPKGHLPAWWFWKIPRSKAFQYGGLGLLKERGGCRVDAYTLPAFMYVLKKCGIKPR